MNTVLGMITLEDLLEEIVGEIRDEYDEDEEELIQKMSEDTYLVEGSMKLLLEWVCETPGERDPSSCGRDSCVKG